jgi:hypothetical protein
MKTPFAVALLAGTTSALEAWQLENVFDGSAMVTAARAKAGAKIRYPRSLDLDLPYQSSTLQLHLEVNADLFSSDWFAASWDDAGELVDRVDNAEDYMCHYLGSVAGMPDSVVALSVCDGIGIQGRIASSDAGLDLGVRATDMSLRSVTHVGEHAIFNMTSLMDGVEDFGEEVDPGNRDDDRVLGPHNDPTARNSQSRYVNNAVFVSSRLRIQQFSNSDQERSSTQSDINNANSYYLSNQSRWNGDPPTHTIRCQEQNPSQWDQSGPDDLLPKCRDYKQARWGNADNLQCLRYKVESGPVIGRAYGGSMCGGASVAWSSNNNNNGRLGSVLAHEMGHNYGFAHEDEGIMRSSGGDNYFGPEAVSMWSQRRDNFQCLR